MPEVSVLIPAFKAHHLDLAITSILAQTFKDFEVIVADDSDGFEIESVMEKWEADRRIIFCKAPRPKYLWSSWDYLIERSEGRYLKFCFDDDFLMPRSLEYLVAASKSYQVPIAFHYRSVADFDGLAMQLRSNPATRMVPMGQTTEFQGAEIARAVIGNSHNVVGEPTCVLLDANAVKPLEVPFGFHGRRMLYLTDVGLYMTLADSGANFACVGYRGSVFRSHDNQTSSSSCALFSAGQYEWEMFARWAADEGLIEEDEYLSVMADLLDRYERYGEDFPELKSFLEMGGRRCIDGRYLGEEFMTILEEADKHVEEEFFGLESVSAASRLSI